MTENSSQGAESSQRSGLITTVVVVIAIIAVIYLAIRIPQSIRDGFETVAPRDPHATIDVIAGGVFLILMSIVFAMAAKSSSATARSRKNAGPVRRWLTTALPRVFGAIAVLIVIAGAVWFVPAIQTAALTDAAYRSPVEDAGSLADDDAVSAEGWKAGECVTFYPDNAVIPCSTDSDTVAAIIEFPPIFFPRDNWLRIGSENLCRTEAKLTHPGHTDLEYSTMYDILTPSQTEWEQGKTTTTCLVDTVDPYSNPAPLSLRGLTDQAVERSLIGL